jgi:DNA-binding MarR family transcriptional regulator
MPAPAETLAEQTPQTRLSEGALQGVIGYQLAQASLVSSAVFADAVGKPCALRPVEYTVLALVEANPGLTARQLARGLAVTPPNITLWLDRLEARELVTRTRCERDGRLQHVQLTARGTSLVRRATRRLQAAERQAISTLSVAEQAMLVELAHKMALARGRPGGG